MITLGESKSLFSGYAETFWSLSFQNCSQSQMVGFLTYLGYVILYNLPERDLDLEQKESKSIVLKNQSVLKFH